MKPKIVKPVPNRLSILIPSRNEEFLEKTIADIKEHAEGDVEILTEEDSGLGQRGLTNKLARQATGEYLMKLDAHCSLSQGFDVALLEKMDNNTIMTPILARLHAFDWVCEECGVRQRQDNKPTCHDKLRKEIVWDIEHKPFTTRYYFDSNFVFNYCPHEDIKDELVETMALQGSCFVISKEKYFELDICDEKIGSWGAQGVETALKAWLSGMRVVTNTNAYYGHMFRTSDIPYERPQSEIDDVYKKTRDMWLYNRWPKQIKPLSWVLNKFNPPNWDDKKEFVDKQGLLFYKNKV